MDLTDTWAPKTRSIPFKSALCLHRPQQGLSHGYKHCGRYEDTSFGMSLWL